MHEINLVSVAIRLIEEVSRCCHHHTHTHRNLSYSCFLAVQRQPNSAAICFLIHSCFPVMLTFLLLPCVSSFTSLTSGGSVSGPSAGEFGPAWQQRIRGLSAGTSPPPHLPPQAGPPGPGQPLHVRSFPLQGGAQTAGVTCRYWSTNIGTVSSGCSYLLLLFKQGLI